MAYTMDDARHDAAVDEWFREQSLEREKLLQCIYLLVEGDSEAAAFPELLLAAGLDLEEHGVMLVNLQGVANASHLVRALTLTLSADRPVVLVVDDDPAGVAALKHPNLKLHRRLITRKVPNVPRVLHDDGTNGGSFEEMFDLEVVVTAALATLDGHPGLPDAAQVLANVDAGRPWLKQINKFLRDQLQGFGSVEKSALSVLLSDSDPPDTIKELAQTILEVRAKYPVLAHSQAATEGKEWP